MNGGPVEDQNQWEVQNRTGLCKGRCIIECYGFRKAMASWSCYVNVVSHGHGRASRMYDWMRTEVYNLWWSMLAMYSSQIHILCQDDLPRRSWLVRLRSSWESYTIYTCLFSSWEWGCRNVWTHRWGVFRRTWTGNDRVEVSKTGMRVSWCSANSWCIVNDIGGISICKNEKSFGQLS